MNWASFWAGFACGAVAIVAFVFAAIIAVDYIDSKGLSKEIK